MPVSAVRFCPWPPRNPRSQAWGFGLSGAMRGPRGPFAMKCNEMCAGRLRWSPPGLDRALAPTYAARKSWLSESNLGATRGKAWPLGRPGTLLRTRDPRLSLVPCV